MGEIARKVKPRHRPMVHNPVEDDETKHAWIESQALPDKPTRAQFEKDHSLPPGELERILDRCRKRVNREAE
jgi:hypothetical protein